MGFMQVAIFINILQAHFSYQSVSQLFSSYILSLQFFGERISAKKSAMYNVDEIDPRLLTHKTQIVNIQILKFSDHV